MTGRLSLLAIGFIVGIALSRAVAPCRNCCLPRSLPDRRHRKKLRPNRIGVLVLRMNSKAL